MADPAFEYAFEAIFGILILLDIFISNGYKVFVRIEFIQSFQVGYHYGGTFPKASILCGTFYPHAVILLISGFIIHVEKVVKKYDL